MLGIRCGLAITDALNCFFGGFKRRDSLTSILMNLGPPSFDTVLADATASCNRTGRLFDVKDSYPRIFESAAFRADTGDDGVIFVRSITIIKRRMWRRRDVSSRLTN